MKYDTLETDDFLATMVISDIAAQTVQLYLIKWDFDTPKIEDLKKLARVDDQKLGIDGDYDGMSANGRDGAIHLSQDQLNAQKKKSCCNIF